MERKDYLRTLWHQYLNNNCSESELTELLTAIQRGELDEALNHSIDAHEMEVADSEPVDPLISQQMRAQITQRLFESPDHKSTVRRFPSVFIRVAAGLAGVFFLATALYFFLTHGQETVISTAYGQQKRITLPDQSVVTLNGHSSLRYKADFQKETAREVYLEGEAFFAIVRTSEKKRFVVHTTNHVDVEVLGTQFNVSDRKKETRVVLKSGKVRIHLPNKQYTEQAIEMKPGDLVQVQAETRKVERKLVDPEMYASWRANKLIFKNTRLGEIVKLLEDNYGYTADVRDPLMLEEPFTAVYPSDNPDILLRALTRAFGAQVDSTKKRITIRKP